HHRLLLVQGTPAPPNPLGGSFRHHQADPALALAAQRLAFSPDMPGPSSVELDPRRFFRDRFRRRPWVRAPGQKVGARLELAPGRQVANVPPPFGNVGARLELAPGRQVANVPPPFGPAALTFPVERRIGDLPLNGFMPGCHPTS